MSVVRGVVKADAMPFAPGVDTFLGSLPHTDSTSAIEYVLTHHVRLPAAPELPKRSPLEGMIARVAWGISGVNICDDGSISIDHGALDPRAPLGDPKLLGEPFKTLRMFLHAVAFRDQPIKLQITGPVTLGVALFHAGVPASLAFSLAGSAVRSRSQALLDLADQIAPLARRVMFVDEPAFTGLLHPKFPLGRVDAVDLTSSVLAVIEQRAITGLHCCGETDWKLALDTGPRILSVPLGQGIETASEPLGGFLEDGGWVAWGAVPTDEPIGSKPGRLWRHLSTLWCQLVQGGCDPVRLRTQALVTPACGLANHGISQIDQVMRLTRQVAGRIHDQALGVRLAIGA